jgi:hypothetical protein
MDQLSKLTKGFDQTKNSWVACGVRNKMAAIKFEKNFVDPGGFWLSYQDPLHSERG